MDVALVIRDVVHVTTVATAVDAGETYAVLLSGPGWAVCKADSTSDCANFYGTTSTSGWKTEVK